MGDYWKGGGLEDSSEMEGSPPTYSSGEGAFGFKTKQQAQKASKKGDGDAYDFEIEGGDGSDEDIDLGGYQPRAAKPSSMDARRQSQTRRKSTDQRTEEILRQSREAARIGAAGADAGKASDKIDEIVEEPQTDSWKNSWEDLMGGLNSPSSDAASPPQRAGVTSTGNDSAIKDIESSYNSDSMDISASDFQVGADAAKRAKEKTMARQRRKALEEAPHVTKERQMPTAKVAASPDVKLRQAGRDAPPSFQISTALSSIQRSADSLQISEDGGETGYLGHGGVASSRGDGDLYKMLGGRDSAAGAAAAGTSRYSQNVSGSESPAARRADVSDFSNSADGPPVVGAGGAGDSESIESEDSGDSGDSDLAQSADFVNESARERRKGFSGASGPTDTGLSSDEYNSEEEKERKKKRDAELAMSVEDREERGRLQKMEEIRNRWLNPGSGPGTAAAVAAGGSALDYLEESNDKREEDKMAPPPKTDITASSAGSGSDLPHTEADRRLANEEADLMQQMVDPNPAAMAMAPPTGISADLSQSKLITTVGSASMVTSVPPPPPPAMTASEDNMVMTQAGGSTLDTHPASRTSVLLYSDSDAAEKTEDTSLGLGEGTLPDQDSVLQGLAVGTSNNRYSSNTDDSPERATTASAPAPAAGPAAAAKKGVAAVNITKNPQYIAQLAQYQQEPVVIAHDLDVGDDRDTLRSGGATAVDAYGRRSAASGSGGQPFLNKVVATEIDPATLGIQPSRRSQERGRSSTRDSYDTGVPVGGVSARPPPPPAPTSWPKELPMANPNTTDLHAHLAMMESSEARRIMAVKAQAAKIRETKAVNRKQSTPAAAAGAAKRTAAAKGGPDYSKKTTPSTANPPAVNRLEAGTARLARQFEMLEKELKAVKASRGGGSGGGGGDSSVQVAAGITPAAVGGYAGTRTPSSIPVAAPRSQQQPVDLGIVPPPAPASREPRGRDSAEQWEGEALTSMRRIVAESDKLDEKAKALAAREEALRVREAMVDIDYRNPNRNGRMAPGGTKGADAAAGDGEEHPLVQELQEIEKRQQEEINALKARCFKLQNRLDDAEDPDKSLDSASEQGGGSGEKKESKRKHYTELLGDKKDKDNEEEEMITVPRAKYDGLFDEIKSQETLIEGFQKENEKLLSSLRAMEAEYNRDKAKFFDQRESINRDLNRLRNATGETASEQLAPATVTGSIGFPAPSAGAGGGDGGVRRSAETLREELDTAATIFNLKEQLAVAESNRGNREQELQKTIERLRSDVRDLQAEKAGVTAKSVATLNAEKTEQESKVRGLETEIASLKRKLVWYAENQALIDDAEREMAELSSVQSALMKELRRRGMEAPQVQALVSLAMDHRGRAEPPSLSPSEYEDEDSMMSGFGSRSTARIGAGGRGGSKQQHRSNADVKRIRDLESIVEELQDTLKRRNPDSVSSLVRAATVGEDVQEERREHAATVERLRGELTGAHEEYDRRLRSLRQEHDKVKIGYENRIRGLEELIADASVKAVPPSATGSAAAGGASSEGAKSLATANTRIKELEAEAARIRSFYTKKVEETQKKAEAQLHALKRAPASPQFPSASLDVAGGGAATDTDTIAPTGSFAVSEADKLANLRAELQQEHEVEVTALQKQLEAQAKEIGSLRANSRVEALLAASGLMPPSPASTASSYPATPTPSEKVVEAVRSKGRDMTPLAAAISAEVESSLTSAESEQAQQAVDSLLAAAAALSPVPLKIGQTGASASAGAAGEVTAEQVRASPLWQAELSTAVAAATIAGTGTDVDSAGLTRRLREEEMRASNLMSEVVQLRTQLLSATNVNAPYPVQMPVMQAAPAVNPSQAAQMDSMERHVKALETRLTRRETELMGAIESSKTGAKLERARLEALHQAEIREKDEQLVRFQQELEQLVYCLRQWQMEAKTKGSSSIAMGEVGMALPGMPPSPATALMPVL